jgi:hypothetical protein
MSYTNLNWDFSKYRLQAPTQLLAVADLWTPHAAQVAPLGAIYETRDGRRFRYCKADSTQIAKAVLVQAAVWDPQSVAKVQTSYGVAAGVSRFDILMTTANAISDSDLIDGVLLISDGGAAMGDMYMIKNNKWTTSDTVLNIEIADRGGLRNAIAATDDASPFKNKYHSLIVKPTTLTAPIVGVTLTIVPASYFFWGQTRGWAAILTDESDDIVVGEPVGHIDGTTAAGTVGLVSTHASDVVIGTCVYDSAVSEAAIIDLHLE